MMQIMGVGEVAMRRVLLVGIGGFLGSAARYAASGAVQTALRDATFPYGTAVVNVTGCLLIGALSAIPAGAGAFSYSGTFTYDDDMVIIPFTVTDYTTVAVQSWSFGGGVNARGDTIAAGGFAPILDV